MSQLILNDNTLGEFEHYYMNNMQLLANIIDPNMLFAEVARAGVVKEISAIAGGKGGGKPDFAMAGLKDETKIDEALAAVKGIVEKQLG